VGTQTGHLRMMHSSAEPSNMQDVCIGLRLAAFQVFFLLLSPFLSSTYDPRSAVRLPDNAPDRIKDGYVAEIQFLDDIILSHVIQYVAPAPTGLVECPQDQNYGFIKKPNMSLANIEFNLSLYDQLIQNDNFMNLKRDVSLVLIV